VLAPRSLLIDGRNEALPALAAAIGENLAAATGRHAGAKAVRARPANVVGLIGTLHDGSIWKGFAGEHLDPIRSSIVADKCGQGLSSKVAVAASKARPRRQILALGATVARRFDVRVPPAPCSTGVRLFYCA